MRCLLPLIVLLGAVQAVPFFKFRFGPEHRSDELGPELPPEPFPQRVPDESAAVFALQLPKLDLSDLFRPLRVFAGVNVDHPSGIAVREEEPNCDLGKFDLADDEFDIVMDCQKASGGDDVELKECILTKLPKTAVELRDFLDREEFGVAGLSSSFHLSLLNGAFTQKRSVQFRLCPRDEVNSIDGPVVPVVEQVVPVVEEVVPMVEEMVPIEALSPDRIDESAPSAPGAVIPPQRPLFQFPELKLPNFGQIFTEAFAPVFGPRPGTEEEDAGLGLFGSHLNPFAVRHPPAVTGPQHGFFASLFPALAATPPPQGPPDGIDMDNCDSQKFDVSRFVFNVANRCQYANDYRKCLRLDLAGDKSAQELLDFATDTDYSVVASSFSSFQTTFDLESLHDGKGLLDLKRKNQIDLRRCANIVKEVPTEAPIEKVTTEAEPVAEVAEEVTPEVVTEVVEELVPDVVAEVIPEGTLDVVPEEIPVVIEEYPSEPAPGVEVTPEVAPEEPQATTEVFQTVPEVVEAVDAEKEAVEAKKAAEPEEPVVVAEKPVESEKPVETEKPQEAEPATEVAVETEKVAVETEKAPDSVETPVEVSQPVEFEGNVEAGPKYDVAEP
ncbi:uncharacterized protein LOC122372557 [Amphibalanus amphitrite]|uniref:uncharacterized protein LOC122372557 n=1 Tax=Amphibalanus amphitrite TaxID=1232801 RepID=UPI001C92248E|nr:uncharacterized protein LOC122372557 [Amphibalanus amphitrite]